MKIAALIASTPPASRSDLVIYDYSTTGKITDWNPLFLSILKASDVRFYSNDPQISHSKNYFMPSQENSFSSMPYQAADNSSRFDPVADDLKEFATHILNSFVAMISKNTTAHKMSTTRPLVLIRDELSRIFGGNFVNSAVMKGFGFDASTPLYKMQDFSKVMDPATPGLPVFFDLLVMNSKNPLPTVVTKDFIMTNLTYNETQVVDQNDAPVLGHSKIVYARPIIQFMSQPHKSGLVLENDFLFHTTAYERCEQLFPMLTKIYYSPYYLTLQNDMYMSMLSRLTVIV